MVTLTHVLFGVLWGEVLVLHDRVPKVTTVATRASAGKMATRLVIGYSGCTLRTH